MAWVAGAGRTTPAAGFSVTVRLEPRKTASTSPLLVQNQRRRLRGKELPWIRSRVTPAAQRESECFPFVSVAKRFKDCCTIRREKMGKGHVSLRQKRAAEKPLPEPGRHSRTRTQEKSKTSVKTCTGGCCKNIIFFARQCGSAHKSTRPQQQQQQQ